MQKRRIPKHLGLVPGGHGAWAVRCCLPHPRAWVIGLNRLLKVLNACDGMGVEFVSIYLLPSDHGACNAVGSALQLQCSVRHYLQSAVQALVRSGFRVQMEGAPGASASRLDKILRDAENRTLGHTGLKVQVMHPALMQTDLSAGNSCWRQPTAKTPGGGARAPSAAPELVIRTGGALPTTEFMMWNTGETALYFTDVSWPDFTEQAFWDAMRWYLQSERSGGVEAMPHQRGVRPPVAALVTP